MATEAELPRVVAGSVLAGSPTAECWVAGCCGSINDQGTWILPDTSSPDQDHPVHRGALAGIDHEDR